MALKQVNSTVNTTPSVIFQLPAGQDYTAVQVSNGHSSSIYLGATSSVSNNGANHGQTLGAAATVQIWLRGGDTLWAVTATGTTGTGDVSVIYSGF
jgi:hypothetical protein